MLPTTKAGPGEKEPAYIVLKRHAVKFVLLLVFIGALIALKFYNTSIDVSRLEHSARAFAHNMKFTQNSMISSFTKVGEEYERHLDQDIRELRLVHDLLASLNSRFDDHLANVTRTVESTMEELIEKNESEEAKEALREAQHALDIRSTEITKEFLRTVTDDISKLVTPLLDDAKRAQERRSSLQHEISSKLKHSQDVDDHLDGDLNGDGFIEDVDGDGYAEQQLSDFTDDEWLAQTESWHNETVTSFFGHLDQFLNDPNTTRMTLTIESKLFQELEQALAHLYEDKVPWHDVQDLIHLRQAEFRAVGLPEYKDADPPADDEFTGFQSWHVQAYLEECLWPARLKKKIKDINDLRKKWQSKETNSLDAVGLLEEYASDNIVPHHWLHHGYGDDMYGAFHDDYF